ncbi:hypothetical protein PR048_027201 [Dryococelus australis]|uniref:Uncharacterized protein n=1 Tax=Dryococelus australis TaxID=614101 RepID=A0ABQ9GET2_9NEOP|nr:hypothetical protein PR048_027201 [Dryococelus australis]
MASGGSAQIKPGGMAKNIESKLSGFKITAQDLRTPTKELVIAYYTAVMEEFGVDFGASYRLHDVSHAVKLYHIVAYVFSKLGFRLSFDDIMNPGMWKE